MNKKQLKPLDPSKLRQKCCFIECRNPAITEGDWEGFCVSCATALSPDVDRVVEKIDEHDLRN